MSRKLIWLSKTALSVSLARSSSTEKSKVSGMSPSGAHPTHNGETDRPVPPRVLLDEGSTTLFSTIPPVLARYAPSAARRAAASVSSSAFSTLLLPRSASLIPSQMASSTAG